MLIKRIGLSVKTGGTLTMHNNYHTRYICIWYTALVRNFQQQVALIVKLWSIPINKKLDSLSSNDTISKLDVALKFSADLAKE